MATSLCPSYTTKNRSSVQKPRPLLWLWLISLCDWSLVLATLSVAWSNCSSRYSLWPRSVWLSANSFWPILAANSKSLSFYMTIIYSILYYSLVLTDITSTYFIIAIFSLSVSPASGDNVEYILLMVLVSSLST